MGTIFLSSNKNRTHIITILLAASMFATGFSGLVSEYILSTVSTYVLGNSIKQFCVIIGLMMMMMGIAYYVQKFFSDRTLVEKFIFVETGLALLGGFAPLAIYAAFGYLNYHFKLVQYFLVMSIGFLIGFELPLVVRINQEYARKLKINLAQMYGADYIGAFVGAIIWVYLLLPDFPLTQISFMVAGANFLVALISFAYFFNCGMVKHRCLTLTLIFITSIGLFVGYKYNGAWSISLEQKLYDYRIIFSETTEYQHLIMTHDKALDEYRFYINGNLQFSSFDENIYHEQLVHPVMNLVSRHRNVLILGGGDGLALREVLKYPDVESVTLVDLDPAMTEFCSANPVMRKLNNDAFADARVKKVCSGAVVEEGTKKLYQETGKFEKDGSPIVEEIAQVTVINIDADRFIDEIRGKWDVVIIDFPDPNAIELAKLYSREFYLKLRRVLNDNGMVTVQSTSPYHARESFACIRRTLEASGFDTLPYHENVPSFGDWSWIIAWKEHVPWNAIQFRIDNLHFPVSTTHLDPEVFRASTVFAKDVLVSVHTEINTLMRPVLLEYYLAESWLVD